MTAFRFLRQLRLDGFVHQTASVIRLVRLPELFEQWQAIALRPTAEVAARWVLFGHGREQIERALKTLGDDACVALLAAADALHLGVVRAVATSIYVRSNPRSAISKMQLLPVSDRSSADVIVKVPAARESVFRGAVDANGIRSADVLQVWLDVQGQPSRGEEQADIIHRRVIAPMLKRAERG